MVVVTRRVLCMTGSRPRYLLGLQLSARGGVGDLFTLTTCQSIFNSSCTCSNEASDSASHEYDDTLHE